MQIPVLFKRPAVRARRHFKGVYDRVSDHDLKKNMLQAIPFWIASVVTGLIAVLYARLFLMAEEVTAMVFEHHAWMIFIVTPTCFLLSWWIVQRFAPYARGSGIPQVIAALEISNPRNDGVVAKLLSLRIIVVKILSSLVMAMGGGVIGREGPTIQIAASVFKKINSYLPEWWPKVAKTNMIITGAAAGLAAAFNTPLGGIVFAIEELTKTHFSYFKTAIFSSVIIAGLTAQGILGPYLYLGYPKIGAMSPFIVGGVILVALIAGLLGSSMAKIILLIMKRKAKLKLTWKNVVYIMCCAFALASLAYFVDKNTMGSGKNIMETALFTSDKYGVWYMPILRIIGPMLSFTTGAAGGIFAPALTAGASIGSMVAGWFSLSDSNANLLVLTGMVGLLTGVTRSPFTSAILVLEMTDRHNVIFYLILAGMVSSLVSILIDKHSFYDHLKDQYIRDLAEDERQKNVITQAPVPAGSPE